MAAITVFGFSDAKLNIRFMVPPGIAPDEMFCNCTPQDGNAPTGTAGISARRTGQHGRARPERRAEADYESGCIRAEYETYAPPQSGGAADTGLGRGLGGNSAERKGGGEKISGGTDWSGTPV
jgi:hypothetical protein